MGMRKGMFFTIDAIIASMILVIAILIVANTNITENPNTDINYYAKDIINVLSELTMGEIEGSIITALENDGNLTEKDLNTSVLDFISILWAEGKEDASANLSSYVMKQLLPEEYDYGLWVEGDILTFEQRVNQSNLVSYRKFVSGIEEGQSLRGYLSKVYFTSIENKRTNAYIYFGGFIGEGNISSILTLPENFTISTIIMELDIGNDFNLTINGNNAGSYDKGSNGGGYMQADIWDISTYKGFLKEGDNIFKINFDNRSNNYIGGGYIKVTYDTNYKGSIDRTYSGGNIIKKIMIPGINGIMNIYDSVNIPGTLNHITLHTDFYSNYTTYVTLGNTTLLRNTTDGNHSITLTSTEIEALLNNNSVTYEDLSNSTIPFRIGLEDVTYIGITGATDTVLVTDLSGSMWWYSNAIKNMTNGSFTHTSYQKKDEFTIASIDTKNLVTDTNADWSSGTRYNVTVSSDTVRLIQNGSYGEALDQYDYWYNDYTTVYGNYVRSQIFTPSIDGNLTEVHLAVMRYGNAPDFVVEIRDVSGGYPGTTVLGSTQRGDIDTGYYADYTFSFATPVTLNAGTQYAILFKTYGNGGTDKKYYRVLRETWNTYADGYYCYSNNNEGSWTALSYDAYFSTYMQTQEYNANGEITIQKDAGEIVSWVSAQVNSTEFSGTSVSVSYRTSNDSLIWSSWSSAISSLPDGRYLEKKISLFSDGSNTPIVDSVEVMMTNETNRTVYDSFDVVMQFTGNTYTSNNARMRLLSPSGQWYGDGLGGGGNYMEVSYERTNYMRILEGAYEEGTWEVYLKTTNGKEVEYTLVEQYPDERIAVAREADILFVNTLSENDKNRVGLVGYDDDERNYDSLTYENNSLISRIESTSYDPNGGTCICCGINRARNLLPSNGSRYIVVMSDGDANYICDDFDDYTGKKDYDGGPTSAVQSAEYACSQNITVYSVGFGMSITENGTETLKSIACNESLYYNAQNSEQLYSVLHNISQQILEISYTKQSVTIEGSIDYAELYPTSYIEINYTPQVYGTDFGEIFISTNTDSFGNTVSNTSFMIPEDVELVDLKVSSYSAESWTTNVTVENSQGKKDIFHLAKYSDYFQEMGDPYIISVQVSDIMRNEENIFTVHTGISIENTSSGSEDNRIFYTFVVKNFAESPQVGDLARGCEWELEYTDGSKSTIKVPSNYAGIDICYYKNATYNDNDSIDLAAYALFSQLDLNGDGTVVVRIDDNNLVAEHSVIDNVPSMWGPSMSEVRIWR
jgi:hypothetical protein